MMRVIAGAARGLPLHVPRGTGVRPTSARVRTSLFSILAGRIEGARVLDLFAGSGALGIEALSRGAAFCCFVESARPALAALRDNLARARFADRAEVLPRDAFAALLLIESSPPFDVVLLDPPYSILHEQGPRLVAFLGQLAGSSALAPEAIVVLQHDTRALVPSAVGPLCATDRRDYGTASLTFFERAVDRVQ